MKPTFSRSHAFTLVELLVAMAVLSLLVLLLAQVVSTAGQAININSKYLDAAAQERLVFDRLGTDLAARPRRSDLGLVFNKATTTAGNDSLRFYSQVTSYQGTRGITAVGYRIPTTATTTGLPAYELERGAVGTDFNPGTALMFLPQKLSAADAFPMPADNPDTEYEVLANGVFRFEFCYLLTSGKLTSNTPVDLSTISAIVVAIGVLDTKSLRLLSSPPASQIKNLSDAFGKTPDGADPLTAWNAILNAGLSVAGVSKAVCQNVHVYERTFYVP